VLLIAPAAARVHYPSLTYRTLSKWLVPPSQVPYTVTDNELSDTWECSGNAWDSKHASCSVGQELSNQAIDEILAMQVGGGFMACLVSSEFPGLVSSV